MSFQSDRWDTFYAGYPAKDILNKKLDQIIKLLPATATQDECITVLRGTPGLSLLAVDEFNEVLLLHQVMITGPNLLQPESKIMALMGGNAIADCYRIHPSSFTSSVDIPCPKWSDLKAAATLEEVATLHVSEANSPKLKGKKLLPIPPIMAITIITAGTSNAVALIPMCLQHYKNMTGQVKWGQQKHVSIFAPFYKCCG